MTTLYVVAHRVGARLLLQDGAAVRSIEEIDHPEGRLRNIDHDSDRPGRTHDSSGRRHGLEGESAHDHIATDFARRLARRMDELRTSNAFDASVLVAEPRFLGILRGALDETTAKTVRATLAKDLSHVETRDLAEHLAGAA